MERFILNETSYFGKGSRKVLVSEIKKRHFENVLVVTDEELFKIGISNKVTDMLEAEDIKFTIYHDVKPNPTIQNVMDGVELCKKIRKDEDNTITPVIVVSSKDQKEHRVKILQ